ncbi:hypothetical protein GCM10009665_67260 [Kitasatospora nipponensis]|uniref:Uncharacterized protein n=1 Tax=Kitasatospora nipponensis TaxID=258049 RepID=A0ABP4HMM0_9ACTN
MTSAQQPAQRGLHALIPQHEPSTAGQRAAAQLLPLREVTLPAAVVAAAAELLAGSLLTDPLDRQGDPVGREATTAVLAHLRAALDDPGPP